MRQYVTRQDVNVSNLRKIGLELLLSRQKHRPYGQERLPALELASVRRGQRLISC